MWRVCPTGFGWSASPGSQRPSRGWEDGMSHRRDGPNPFKTPLELPKEPVGSVGAAAWAPPPQSPPSPQPPPAPTGASGGLQSAVAEMLHCGNSSIAALAAMNQGCCPTLPSPNKALLVSDTTQGSSGEWRPGPVCAASALQHSHQPGFHRALFPLPSNKPTPSDSLLLAHQEASPHPALRRQGEYEQF